MKNKYTYLFILLFVLLVSLTVTSASDVNQTLSTDTADDVAEYSVSSSSDFDNIINKIKQSDSSKNTITLNDGEYDSFDLNVDDVELEINGNNQIVSANININIGSNAVVTLNSLTLNHTGNTKAAIVNNGILKINGVHITNSNPVDLELISSKSVVSDSDELFDLIVERRSVLEGDTYTDSSALTIVNNNKLFIENSFMDDNVINSALITNNYLTSISNSSFVNNYADSLVTNNGKLRITDTDIGANYLNHLVKITSSNTTFEPEAYIKDSNINYTLLSNELVKGKYFSTIMITGCYMDNLINPYWMYDSDWAFSIDLTFDGRPLLFNNSDSRFNTIKIYTKYLNQYREEFNNYFEKTVPMMKVEYDGVTSTINVTLTDINSNSVDGGNVIIIVDANEIDVTDNTVVNGNCLIKLSDAYSISSADDIMITYNGNDKYSAITQYYDNKFYSNRNPDLWDDEAEYDEGYRSIPGINSGKYVGLNIINGDEDDFYPKDVLSLKLWLYHMGDDYTVINDEIPDSSIIKFYLDDVLTDITDEMEYVGYDDAEKVYLYEYVIPEDISGYGGLHKIVAAHINPEYVKTESFGYFYVISNDTENQDNPINVSIVVSDIYQEGNSIIIEGQINVDYQNYAFTEDIKTLENLDDGESWYLDYSDVNYFDGTFKINLSSDGLFNDKKTANITLEYSDYLDDEYIENILDITLEANKKTSGIILTNYTINNQTVIITNASEDNNSIIENDTGKVVENNTKSEVNKNKNYFIHKNHSPVKSSVKVNKPLVKEINSDKLTIKIGFNITLSWLDKIFSNDFSNQLIQIYIDDELVYNSTTGDDLLEVLVNISGKYSGEHTLKVVTADDTFTKEINIK